MPACSANALEAGARQVATTIDRHGNRVTVRIEDDGDGCASADLPRLFEPFFTTKQGPARRGLGLFIVQSIVESHGGTIQVRSKNDGAAKSHGLIFLLEFPGFVPEAPSRRLSSGTRNGISRRWPLALPEPF